MFDAGSDPKRTFALFKEWAKKYLAHDSDLRAQIISQPDDLPFEIARVKLQVYLEMAEREMRRSR